MPKKHAVVGDEELAATNVKLAEQILNCLGSEDLFSHMADDVVIEFPYGPSINMPDRFVNKQAFRVYWLELVRTLPGLTMRDMVFYSVDDDPTTVFSEYEADIPTPAGHSYVQVHVNKMQFRDGLLVRMREFQDPQRILDARAGLYDVDPDTGTTPMEDRVLIDRPNLRGATVTAALRAEGGRRSEWTS